MIKVVSTDYSMFFNHILIYDYITSRIAYLPINDIGRWYLPNVKVWYKLVKLQKSRGLK